MISRRRRRRIERRGRPRSAVAKRRATTTAGRAGAPDRGTGELRRKKRAATTRDDLEISPIGALFGRGVIDAVQYDALDGIAVALRRLAFNLGPRPDAVALLWQVLTGAAIGSTRAGVPAAIGSGADPARRQLGRMLRQLDGSRALVVTLAEGRVPPIVLRAVASTLTAADQKVLDHLRDGLDRVAGRGRERAG